MNGVALLLLGCGLAGAVLLRAVFRDGPGFHDRLASFDEHTDQALAVVDGSLTDAESTVWHEIVAGYGATRQHRMRPESRITPTLAAIEAVWRLHPDWRLGQLVSNLAGRDPFYIEDDALAAAADARVAQVTA